jgi:tetratricopeptide (TPR) repeat protein
MFSPIQKRAFFVFFLSLRLCVTPLAAQRTPGGQTGQGGQGGQGQPGQGQGGRGTTPGVGRDNNPMDNRRPGSDNDRNPFEGQRPIFLSGKVMLEDGTPPPDPVTIERICNGNARAEAYTDSKGRFSFQLGQNMAVMQDASMSSISEPGIGAPGARDMTRNTGMTNNRGLTERDLTGCELRATAAGYRSDIVNLAGRRAFDNPDVGTILLRRLGDREGTTVSATSLQAPKDAKKAHDKAREAFKKQKWDDAVKEGEKAVAIYPKYAAAWFDLGLAYEQRNRLEDARKSYSEAMNADPKFINPYLQVALLAARERKWDEVAATSERALKLNPFDFPMAYYYNAVANLNLDKIDAAEKSAREGQKLDSEHRIPKIDQVLGVILARKQDFSGATEQLRNYLKFAPQAQDAEMVRNQLTEWEKVAGPVKTTP